MVLTYTVAKPHFKLDISLCRRLPWYPCSQALPLNNFNICSIRRELTLHPTIDILLTIIIHTCTPEAKQNFHSCDLMCTDYYYYPYVCYSTTLTQARPKMPCIYTSYYIIITSLLCLLTLYHWLNAIWKLHYEQYITYFRRCLDQSSEHFHGLLLKNLIFLPSYPETRTG